MLTRNAKTVIAVVIIASLIALNVYTVEVLSLKSPAPIPSYPSVTLAYSGGNMTILISGALGPYTYDNISINGTFGFPGGKTTHLTHYRRNAIFLGLTLPAENASFNSTAIDGLNHVIYYFNATVTVNLSAPTTDVVTTYAGGGELNSINLGVNPLEAAMEGYRYA